MPPFGAFAICRIAPMVPTRFSAAGSASSASLVCRLRNSSRSDESARFTESIDAGRLIASG